jgi:hypothetical protein
MPRDVIPVDGTKVRKLRNGLGLTSEQFGELWGYSGAQVLHWEDGTSSVPKPLLSSIGLKVYTVCPVCNTERHLPPTPNPWKCCGTPVRYGRSHAAALLANPRA